MVVLDHSRGDWMIIMMTSVAAVLLMLIRIMEL